MSQRLTVNPMDKNVLILFPVSLLTRTKMSSVRDMLFLIISSCLSSWILTYILTETALEFLNIIMWFMTPEQDVGMFFLNVHHLDDDQFILSSCL